MITTDADVIVIGAGAAGLAAARNLAGRSLRATLIEARDRTGGRVWPASTARDAISAELGAEFIHGPAEETMGLLREIGADAVSPADESWTCRANGDLVRDDDEMPPSRNVFERVFALSGDESVDRFLRRFENDESMRVTVAQARAFVEGFDAADPRIASARAIAEELRSGVDSISARPIGGYRPIFEHLRETCVAAGADLRLSTRVRRISWRRGAVAVDAQSGREQSQTIRARAAIVTLPVGVLRHRGDDAEVAFEPELPVSKRDALAGIEMGDAVRATLWFRTAFWEEICDGRYRESAFFRCSGGAFAAYWTQLPVRARSIVAWAGGPKATALRAASHEEIVGRALDGFGALLGEPELARREFEGGIMHDWRSDPFARGAYSYVLVGGRDARATLGAPIDDTLFFAGEATSFDGQGGTVNGALRTGERAADEAAAALGGRKR